MLPPEDGGGMVSQPSRRSDFNTEFDLFQVKYVSRIQTYTHTKRDTSHE
jgi:hypothetical protein